jgi:hypothetical protein
VVVPVIGGDFEPGSPSYEWLLRDMRSEADLFLLALPFGVISEQSFYRYPELLDEHEESQRMAYQEGLVNTRAWLEDASLGYARIAVVKRGPLMELWSKAVVGSPAAKRVRVVPVNSRLGWRDTLLRKRISRALA